MVDRELTGTPARSHRVATVLEALVVAGNPASVHHPYHVAVECLARGAFLGAQVTGGFYKDSGPIKFVRRYGYSDKSGKPDRLNFGGIYASGKDHNANTGVRIAVDGYDAATGKISNLDGSISLLDREGEVAASWSFKGMMAHWNRKHAQAAYVPSLFRTPPPEYWYGPRILLCEETDFLLFLSAFTSGVVYYDLGVKLENASLAAPTLHRRSQFRVRHKQITQLYRRSEVVQL